MIRNKVVICFSLLHFSCLFGQNHSIKTADTLLLSLTQVWEKAASYSRAIELKDIEVDLKEEEINDLRMERLPEIALIGTAEKATNMPIYDNGLFRKPSQHEIIHTLYKAKGDFYLNIYNGNKLNLKIKESKFIHEISKIERDKTIAIIKYKSAEIYLDIIKSHVFKDLVTQDILDQEKQLEEIKSLFTHGVILKSDVLRIELDLSKRKMLLVQIENDILIANQKLNILMGEPDESVLIPSENLLDFNDQSVEYNHYLELGLKHSFDYHISEQNTALSELNVHQVQANLRPSIGLYGEYYFANPNIFLFPYSPYWYSLGIAGVRVSIPISALYHNIHKKQAARLEVEKEHVAHHDVADQVRQQVKEAYLRYEEAILQIAVSEVDVQQALENARIIKDNYFNQTALITDLLDADIQVLQSKFELETAKVEANTKYYLLLTIIGTI